MPTATNSKIWPDQDALEVTQDEYLMAMQHSQSSFLVDFDLSNNFTMSFGGVVNDTL